MKEKLTLSQKLARRKYKPANKIIWWFFKNLVIDPFLAPKYNPHYVIKDNINDEKGPAFVLYNHQSRMDYIWAVQATYPKVLTFVTGYNEFFRSKFDLIFKLIHQIPKKNFVADIASIRAMDQVIKAGGTVCLAPEGMSSITGHSQPIAPGTGKLLKHYKIPVYLVKQKGAFLTNHKVCLDERKGRIDVEFYKLFTPEQLDKLSIQEIEDQLNIALWQDDYEWEKKEHIQFKTNHRAAEHLHDLIYYCPRCKQEFTMLGKDDTIKCLSCNNGAKINDYYQFIPLDDKCILPSTPSKWVDYERELIKKEIRNNPNYCFEEDVTLGKLPEYKLLKNNATSIICGEGKLIVDHQGYHFRGTKDNKPFNFDLNYKEVHTLVIVTDCTFSNIYYNGEYYDLFPKRPSVGKLLLVVEEMHRLHENSWKQLPWLNEFKDEDGNLPPLD